jgi:hypothetical protein
MAENLYSLSYDAYLDAMTSYDGHNGWRRGQTAFNFLHDVRPDLSEQVRGSVRDPFYNDKRLPEFYTWVGENW